MNSRSNQYPRYSPFSDGGNPRSNESGNMQCCNCACICIGRPTKQVIVNMTSENVCHCLNGPQTHTMGNLPIQNNPASGTQTIRRSLPIQNIPARDTQTSGNLPIQNIPARQTHPATKQGYESLSKRIVLDILDLERLLNTILSQRNLATGQSGMFEQMLTVLREIMLSLNSADPTLMTRVYLGDDYNANTRVNTGNVGLTEQILSESDADNSVLENNLATEEAQMHTQQQSRRSERAPSVGSFRPMSLVTDSGNSTLSEEENRSQMLTGQRSRSLQRSAGINSRSVPASERSIPNRSSTLQQNRSSSRSLQSSSEETPGPLSAIIDSDNEVSEAAIPVSEGTLQFSNISPDNDGVGPRDSSPVIVNGSNSRNSNNGGLESSSTELNFRAPTPLQTCDCKGTCMNRNHDMSWFYDTLTSFRNNERKGVRRGRWNVPLQGGSPVQKYPNIGPSSPTQKTYGYELNNPRNAHFSPQRNIRFPNKSDLMTFSPSYTGGGGADTSDLMVFSPTSEPHEYAMYTPRPRGKIFRSRVPSQTRNSTTSPGRFRHAGHTPSGMSFPPGHSVSYTQSPRNARFGTYVSHTSKYYKRAGGTPHPQGSSFFSSVSRDDSNAPGSVQNLPRNTLLHTPGGRWSGSCNSNNQSSLGIEEGSLDENDIQQLQSSVAGDMCSLEGQQNRSVVRSENQRKLLGREDLWQLVGRHSTPIPSTNIRINLNRFRGNNISPIRRDEDIQRPQNLRNPRFDVAVTPTSVTNTRPKRLLLDDHINSNK